MKRKITVLLAVVILLSVCAIPASADVSYIANFDFQFDDGIINMPEAYRLRSMCRIATQGFDTALRLHILTRIDGSASDYAANYISDFEQQYPQAENMILIAYNAEADDVGVATTRNFTPELSSSQLERFLEPFENDDDVLSRRFFDSIILVLEALSIGHDESEYDGGVVDNVTPFLQYRDAKAAGVSVPDSGIPVPHIIIIAAAAVLLIAELIIFIMRGKKIPQMKIIIPVAAVVTIGVAVLAYMFVPISTTSADPLPIPITTVGRSATPIRTEEIKALRVGQGVSAMIDPYIDDVKKVSDTVEGCEFRTEYFGDFLGAHYTQYVSNEIAEQYFDFHTDYFETFYNHNLCRFECIEGSNFKLWSMSVPYDETGDVVAYYFYYLLVDDSLYMFAPYANEIQMYREFIDAMGLDIYYIREVKMEIISG